VTLIVVAAVGILVALAIADALRSGQRSSALGTSSPTTTERPPSLSTEQEIFLPQTLTWKQTIKRIGT
jgi:hypothetical protein